LITPETEATCHYFWAQAHNIQPQNRAVAEILFSRIHVTFLQDVAIFQMEYANIALRPKVPFLNFPFDSGNVQTLRLLGRKIRGEREQTRVAAE
jgi:vanillate O-demethylase monooxygenase subunit